RVPARLRPGRALAGSADPRPHGHRPAGHRFAALPEEAGLDSSDYKQRAPTSRRRERQGGSPKGAGGCIRSGGEQPPELTMHAITWIAEQRIREAIDRGFFDDLPLKGRRLRLEEDESIPPELRMAFKILKDAGCLPPEVELRREIASLSELLDTIADPAERSRLRRELNHPRPRLDLRAPPR